MIAYCRLANQSGDWPYNTGRLAEQPLESGAEIPGEAAILVMQSRWAA